MVDGGIRIPTGESAGWGWGWGVESHRQWGFFPCNPPPLHLTPQGRGLEGHISYP